MTQTPILEAILHPPLGLIQRELIGTVSGSGDLTRDTGALPPFNNVNAYGLTWDIFTLPAGWGIEFGFPNVYEPRLLQAATVHRDFAGHDIVSEYHDFYAEGIYWLWENPGPQYVHYEISPGIELTLFWLRVTIP
jgi:hypothetical protein